MAYPLKRRDFLKDLSLAGLSIAIIDPVAADANTEIESKYFLVTFDKQHGTINVYRPDRVPFLSGATVCINLPARQPGSDTVKRSIGSGAYRHTVRTAQFSDQLGDGKRLLILSKDKDRKLDIEIQVSLYDQFQAITFEVFCTNVSGSDIVINSLEPLRVIKSEGGILNKPGVSKCITNGEMYYDAGAIHEFGKVDDAISSGKLKGVKLANGPISSQSETIHSWWNAGLFSAYDGEGVSIGYLQNDRCLGNLLIAKPAPDQISFLAESVYAPYLILGAGKTIASNRLMVNAAESPYAALEMYADAVGKLYTRRNLLVANGWCSWFYTLAQVSEQEVLTNTEFASKNLKQFGLEYVQIDEGYQRWHGDWEGNARFPHGMKWLATRIKEYGFKPGLWISPYVISEPTEVFQQHPDWLLKHPDGSVKRVGNWDEGAEPPADENPKRYCLDITHPEAAKWLYGLIDRIVNEWGYEMIKIDFMAWSILAAEGYHDPSLSSAAVYRKGLEIMRSAAGDKCIILECGPGATTVGLIDSMRIEADVNYGFRDAAWETYFTHPAGSASAAAKRYYFHKRTWINDADHICLQLLDNQQAEAAATIIGLSGGNVISGDRLTQLEPYKLEILKKVFPSSGEAAIPVDLFDGDMQSVFALRIKRQFAEWTVVGFFNSSLKEPVEKKYSLRRLWLAPGKTYLVFDFWRQQFIGETTNELKVTVQPASVTLLSLHEKAGKPQFISTDRHILQGALEIEDVTWDENTKAISGISKGALHTSYNVSVYIPDEHPWTWSGSGLFRDYDSYSLRLTDKNIIQVRVHFDQAEFVKWRIEPDEFLR